MKQHYIPRFYLRRFSDNGKGIYTRLIVRSTVSIGKYAIKHYS